MIYLTLTAMTFITVFLKGFQHKNVINNLYLFTFITSWMMASMDVLVVGLIAKSIVLDDNWYVMIASGIGGSFGMIASMYVHNRFVKVGKTYGTGDGGHCPTCQAKR